MKSQKGFSAIEGLLILVIVGLLGFVGWFVYNSNTKTNQSLSNAEKTSASNKLPSKPSTSKAGETDGWKSFSTTAGQFSLKYPATWATATEGCSDGLILLGADSKSLGKCASESFGQMSVWSLKVDGQSSQGMDKGGYKDVAKQDVTVAGVSGVRESGVASGQEGPGSLTDGTKVIQYIFTINGRVYVASYVQDPSMPDVLSDFDLMITKTLQFHP
ncbi:hypothetical protein KW794_01470 [Candidatus Saccharibacteria bacterium]|nr:hypothetical protein [Candidatus Saccharibacteria bacterium]